MTSGGNTTHCLGAGPPVVANSKCTSYLALFINTRLPLHSLFSRIVFPATITLLAISCQSTDNSPNKFSDPGHLKIADLQDRGLADSLYTYFAHEHPPYRRDAVKGFASLQDPDAVDKIGKLLLMDPDTAVRKAAAFALGQITHPSSERILLGALVKEKTPAIAFEILQAYGKTTNMWKLDPEVFITDSVKTAGLAWSIYRAGLRGKSDQNANAAAMRLLRPELSHQTRLGAAHFFARGAVNFDDAGPILVSTAKHDRSADVRMAATLALGKIMTDSSLVALKDIYKNETDSRIVVNAVRALGSFPYKQVKHYLYEALNNKDVNVGIASSEVIINKISNDDWIEVSSLTNQVKNWRVKANVYEAALKAGQHADLVTEIKNAYKKLKDPYEKAALLGSLKHFPPEFEFVHSELISADTAVIRSTAASTLVAMNQSAAFPARLGARFAAVFKALVETEEDPAVLGIVASALADPELDHRQALRDPSFLYNAKKKLQLPEHNESLQAIEAAIAHFERKNPPPVENDFNHPIDWNLVRQIPAEALATITTSRGSIIIRLLVEESPGAVANFVQLARQNYFDDKSFHRVVPNFVVQAGCKRGDGWGSEPYSIRSEFSPRLYQRGSVGMASAGKDTEGTQWFITHSPTPHLDGRYTIFAEVTEGMAVVDLLQVGDKILDVEVPDFSAQ